MRHALLVIVAVVCTPSFAAAYVRERTPEGATEQWPAACVSFEVHLDELPGVSAADARAAVSAAAAHWTGVACSGLQIALTFASGAGPATAEDGVSVIGARSDGWCPNDQPAGSGGRPCNNPADVATTSVFAARSGGQIREADIQLNTVTYRWGRVADGGAPPDLQDLEAALTHEIGHAVGLDHPCWSGFGPRAFDDQNVPVPDCYAAPDELRASALFPASVVGAPPVRQLAQDEQRALCEIYPRPAMLPACPAPPAGHGCALGGGTAAPLPALFVLLALFSGRARRSSSSAGPA